MGNFLGEDGIGSIVDLRGRDIVRSQREHQDRRISRISFSICGLAGKIGGKLAASRIDGGLNVAGGGVDIAIQIELESNTSGPEAARGSHLRNAGNAAELALKGRGHCGGHGLRARTGEAGAHANRRKIDLGQRRDGQEPERYGSGEKNGKGDQRRGDRPSNERRGKVGGKVHALISGSRLFDWIADVKGEAAPKPIEREINNRRGIERQQLAENQAADDGNTQRAAQL